MKVMRLCGGILLLANLVCAQGTTSAIMGYNTTPINGYSAFAVGPVFSTVGWTFTASQNIEVTALGSGPIVPPQTGEVEVGLWVENGPLLVSAFVNSASGSGFTPVNPVILQAGTPYVVGAWAGDVMISIPLEPIIAPGIEPIDYAVSPQNAFDLPTPSGPATVGPYTELPLANFQFEAVPEPATIWLVTAGFAAFGFRLVNRKYRQRHGAVCVD